jgi:hypothetical protein
MGSGWIATRLRARGRLRQLGLVVAMVAAVGLLLPSGPASGQTIPPGLIPEGNWTPEQAQWLVNGVRYAEEKLPAYGNRAALPSLGYVNIGPVVLGGYEHWVNVDKFVDGHILNPAEPESIIFQRQSNGTWKLVAAMLFIAPETTMETIPEVIRWVPGWHAHPELCSDDQGRVIGAAIGGQCSRGRPVLTPMVHVWIVDTQCGHRFGGLDGGGLHCEYEDHGDHGEH